MLLNLVITGVGGQGNVLASQVLGQTGVHKGYKVTIGETFGLSQRGGAVMSHVRIYDSGHYGPLIPSNRAHVILGLEPMETLRIAGEYGNEETFFLVNSRPIYPLNTIAGEAEYPDPKWIKGVLGDAGAELVWLEATQKAVELGGPIMLNMIMTGALSGLSGFPFETEDIKRALRDVLPESKLELNDKALDIGKRMVENNEN